MTTSKLPARLSLECLRKKAKKLAHGIVAGAAGAIARAHVQLLQAKLPLSPRVAQLGGLGIRATQIPCPGVAHFFNQILPAGARIWVSKPRANSTGSSFKIG